MPNLMSPDIIPAVRTVLRKAKEPGKNTPAFLTAYQILDRMPARLKGRLVRERKFGGKGTGKKYAAASLIIRAVRSMPDVLIGYLDIQGANLTVGDPPVIPGSKKTVGIYRLKTRAEQAAGNATP